MPTPLDTLLRQSDPLRSTSGAPDSVTELSAVLGHGNASQVCWLPT